VHVRQSVPAQPGPLTLVFPRWLPGYHAPDSKPANLVSLVMTAKGERLRWRRDPVELDRFHIDVPAGASAVDVSFDFVLKSDYVGRELAVFEWHNFVLYPLGGKAADVQVAASAKLPKGWASACALDAKTDGEAVTLAPASLVTLIDSPLFAGKHHAAVDLGQVNGVAHTLQLFGDSADAVELDEQHQPALKKLPAEAFALLGAQHYGKYTFLAALSDELGFAGLEHHECSDNRMKEGTLSAEGGVPMFVYLLAHEYFHSWNGKHRRPAGMITDDYQQPQRTELIWVYEGLTEYYGMVLAARSGAWKPEQFQQAIAANVDAMRHRVGRSWRSLRDVSISAPLAYNAPDTYGSLRRGTDFYEEGALLWLDVDVTIRNLTDGKRSLDDFVRAFAGGQGGKPSVQGYTFDDIVAGLNAVAPHDWAKFLNDRLDANTPQYLDAGVTAGGFTVVHVDEPTEVSQWFTSTWSDLDLRGSLGIQLDPDEGKVSDMLPESPAGKAGVAAGSKVVAVNGLKYSADRLLAAVAESADTPVTLTVEIREQIRTVTLDYNGGPRFPALKRDAAKPDRLTEIATPRTK
jgi:predicted metalloprotease with PDZ domain